MEKYFGGHIHSEAKYHCEHDLLAGSYDFENPVCDIQKGNYTYHGHYH